MKRIAYPSLLVLSLTLAACGGGGDSSSTTGTTGTMLSETSQGTSSSAFAASAAGGETATGQVTDGTVASGSAGAASESSAATAAPVTTASAGTTTEILPGGIISVTGGATDAAAAQAAASQAATPAASTPAASTQSSGTSTTASTAAAAGNGALVTIEQVINDMTASSEAMVIDPRYEWQSKPVIQMYAPRGDAIPSWWTGNRPEWCYNTLTWYTAYEAQGNAATNTRVQIANLRLYVLSESTRKWTLVDTQSAPVSNLWQYPFDVAADNPSARNESSGGMSIKPSYPYFHHGYGNSKTINPQDVRATFVAMEFRLVVDDPSKPDDRAKAKYVVDTGADYYPGNGQGGWGLGYAPAMGNSRMLLATSNWRTASLLVPNTRNGASFDEMKNNPPPLK